MTIDALDTTYDWSSLLSGETSSSEEAISQELDRDDFLTLLVTQLQNQDPLDPLDSAEFTAQLSQFSSLEQLMNVNENLEGIQETLYSQGEDGLIQLIGKTVKAVDNTILVVDESVLSSGSYILEEGSNVSALIYDSSGQEIRTLDLGWQDEGDHTIDWDGLDSDGEMVEDGIYYVEVTAQDEDGNDVDVETAIIGEVNGLTYEFGDPYLMIGGNLVSTNQTIIEIKDTSTE